MYYNYISICISKVFKRMKDVFSVFVIIVLLAILYGFYNIMYSYENNKEDFLIYKMSQKRGFEYLGSK
jgi:hypothetical protein